MKKLLLLGAMLFGVFTVQNAYSQGCCPPVQAPCDQPCGDCICRYVRYEPCYYNTTRCVEECVPCPRRCCRMVPKYYQVQRCRMIPEYYSETICRQEPEYYETCDYKTCKKYVCEPQCKFVPRYYWKRECRPTDCPCP